MSQRVCHHYDVPYEVLTCARCGDAFRCCPVCPGNRAWCSECEQAAAADRGGDLRREGGQ
jgi:hypothetical protein